MKTVASAFNPEARRLPTPSLAAGLPACFHIEGGLGFPGVMPTLDDGFAHSGGFLALPFIDMMLLLF